MIVRVTPEDLARIVQTSVNEAIQRLREEVPELVTKDGWLDKEAAAEYLGVSTRTINNRINDEVLPVYYLGSSPRFRKEDLDKLVKSEKAA